MTEKIENTESPDVFIPNQNYNHIKWLVKDLIPLGHIALAIAKPSAGKSFVVEDLAVCVACNKEFLGFPTKHGNVLIIDEDTPTDTLKRRLSKFYNSCDEDGGKKHKIFVRSMEGNTIKDIPSIIKYYDNIKLVIIDCLVAVAGSDVDLDKTVSAATVGAFMQNIKDQSHTVIITHHISTKIGLSAEEIINHANPQSLAMNNTRIISTCDSLYVLASPEGSKLESVVIRPVSRRATINTKTFTANLLEDDNAMGFEYSGMVNLKAALTKDEKRALDLFDAIGSQMTVKEIFIKSAEYFSTTTAREILKSLESKEYVELQKRVGKGGAMVYERKK